MRMHPKHILPIHRANVLIATSIAVLLCPAFLSDRAFEARAEVPPVPPGYASTDEVKQAILRGKVLLVKLDIPMPENVEMQKGIEYGKGGDVSLKLDLFSPQNITQPAPAMLFIHGGAWKSGSREIYHYYCKKFAERGYVAATMSYRLSNVAPFPAAVEDAKCAVRWLRANAKRLHINPQRIGVAGGSAGGHLSMMVGYASDLPELEGHGGHAEISSRVQAVVNLYGPVDLTTDFAVSKGALIDFLDGKKFDEVPGQYRLASPITHITKDDPPTLILHGSIDETVPIRQAEMLVKRLGEAGVPFEYDRLDGWPHTMDAAAEVNRHCLAKMFEFLDKHLVSTGRGN